MAEIMKFVPKKELDAAQNVAGFIAMCRDELTVFGHDLDFDANSWNVTDQIELKGKSDNRVSLQFSNFDASKQTKGSWTPMAEPFLSFAKAYMRYMHAMKPTKTTGNRLVALRALDRSLSENGIISRIETANQAIFTRAASLVGEKLGASAYRVGKELEAIAKFCSQNNLTSSPLQWKSHLKRDQDKNRIGAVADQRRVDLLPSEAALEALPKVFCLARDPRDVIISAAAAILCGSPDRVNELFALPADCEVEQEYKGKPAYGLRWWPAKGADPMIKWIMPSMVDVVKEAIKRIREKTDEARRIARWYEEHPEQVYLTAEKEHLRSQKLVSINEVADIIGISYSSAYAFINKNGVDACGTVKAEISGNPKKMYAFRDVEAAIVKQLPDHFPIMVRNTSLKYSDALFVIRLNEFQTLKGSYSCLIEPVTIAHINDGLGARVEHNCSSIFSHFDFTEPDGSPLKISTHQFRHWLNTMAQRGGLSQLDIAKWSGRKDIRQNQDYDHMTAGELVQRLRDIAGNDVNIAQLPVEIQNRPPVSRSEFIQMMIPAAHTTDLGFCVHDWTFLPCQLHRDCVHCPEHCYIKGDRSRMDRARQCLAEARQQLLLAEEAMSSEYAGADRWTEHQTGTVARLQNLVDLFDDASLPDGTMIRLAAMELPSQIRIAIEERNRIEGRNMKVIDGGGHGAP